MNLKVRKSLEIKSSTLRFMESPLSFFKACIGTMNLIDTRATSVVSCSVTVVHYDAPDSGRLVGKIGSG